MRRIEVLYFDGCPTWTQAVDLVRQIVDDAGLAESTEVHPLRVESDEEAQRLRFLGSPTIRVDGRDVDTSTKGAVDFGLQCRLYRDGDRFSGLPPAAWVRTALGLKIEEKSVSPAGSSPSCKEGSCR
jgi:hypothetical protein